MIDMTAPRFGLPPSLWVPIAAVSVADIEKYVGKVLQRIKDTDSGRITSSITYRTARRSDCGGTPILT
jgi:hypothetical protein